MAFLHNVKVTGIGGTKLYKHPQVEGIYQGRPLTIISYVAYRRRPSTIIEVRFQNPKPWDYTVFSREESYIAYRSYSDKDKYKTNDESFDKKFSIYTKAEPQTGFKIGIHAMNGIKHWPAGVPLRIYINGPVMSTIIDDVVMNDKKARRVEDLVAAMYQLAPALEQA